MTGHYTRRRYAIIEAPSILGLKPTGVERLSQALLDNRLAERVGARYADRVEPLPFSDGRDAVTGTLNARAIADWSPRLADAIGRVLDAGEFPLVLGGDCSILLGAMLGVRRRGRFGLLFIDGHADFYQPAAIPNGEAASMYFAFADQVRKSTEPPRAPWSCWYVLAEPPVGIAFSRYAEEGLPYAAATDGARNPGQRIRRSADMGQKGSKWPSIH